MSPLAAGTVRISPWASKTARAPPEDAGNRIGADACWHDPLMYDKSYYLEPDGKSSKSYVLLAKTLAETDRVAIVHFALRNKTRLAALRVKDFSKRDVMVIQTLLWPDEIRDPDFPVLDKEVEIKP